MALFGTREIVFEIQGEKDVWKQAKQTLQAADIKIMEAASREGETPLCSCGAKIDRRNYGPNGWIDRRIYYIAVRPGDAARAKELLSLSAKKGKEELL